jgi:hypothetical protein
MGGPGVDRVAIRMADGTVQKGRFGETYGDLFERTRASIAKQFENHPELKRHFDQELFRPDVQYGLVDDHGNFYRPDPTSPLVGSTAELESDLNVRKRMEPPGPPPYPRKPWWTAPFQATQPLDPSQIKIPVKVYH